MSDDTTQTATKATETVSLQELVQEKETAMLKLIIGVGESVSSIFNNMLDTKGAEPIDSSVVETAEQKMYSLAVDFIEAYENFKAAS